jgi:hypothetical protein
MEQSLSLVFLLDVRIKSEIVSMSVSGLLYFWGISNKSNCFAENDILLGQKST